MYYIVNEFQLNNGVPAVISWTFGDRSQALAKYYQTLSACILSSLEMHGAVYIPVGSDIDEKPKMEIIDRRIIEEE